MGKTSVVTFIVGMAFILGGCASTAPAATVPAPATPTLAAPAPMTPTHAPTIPMPTPTAPAPAAAQTPTGGAALFTYSDLKITPNKVKPGGELQVTATVKNVGGQAGTDTAVLDFKPDGDDACPVILPMSKKVTLAAGAVGNVIFDVTTDIGGGGAYIVVLDRLRGKLVVE